MSTKKIEKIKSLFLALNPEEQEMLIRELVGISSGSNSISEFSNRHQKEYGQNIKFEISKQGTELAPEIIATLHSNLGVFEGKGSNQRIAKAKAIEEANKHWEK